MKSNYLIKNYSGKCKAFLYRQGCKLFKNSFSRKSLTVVYENNFADIMNNYLISVTKTSNLKTLDKSHFYIEKNENHISIRKYTKYFRKLFQEVFILSKCPTMSYEKKYEAINIWFGSCVYFKGMCWCLFVLLNSFNQLFFKGEYFPWRA